MRENFRRGTGRTVPLNIYGRPGTFGRAVAEKLAATGLIEAEYVQIAQQFKIKGVKRFKAYIKYFIDQGFNIVLENGRYFWHKEENSSFAGSSTQQNDMHFDPDKIAAHENAILINRKNVEHFFSVGDKVQSGGGRKYFSIIEISDDYIRIKATEASRPKLSFQKISAVINNFHTFNPNRIEASVYAFLVESGLKETSNEVYLYGFAKEYLARSQSILQPSELIPEELTNTEKVFEGAKKTITVNVYERDPRARQACISYWGHSCVICGFDFFAVYGQLGDGFIHVHHLTPIASIGTQYELDPVADLRPVCPNCHAMLHRTVPTKEIDEIKAILKV